MSHPGSRLPQDFDLEVDTDPAAPPPTDPAEYTAPTDPMEEGSDIGDDPSADPSGGYVGVSVGAEGEEASTEEELEVSVWWRGHGRVMQHGRSR